MNPYLAVALLVVGVGCLVWTVLQRRGRHWWAREWAYNEASDMSFQMLGVPGIGLIMTSGSLASFMIGTPMEPLAGIGGLGFLIGAVMGLWGMFTFEPPLWFLPRWSREPIRERRGAEKERSRRKWRRRWEKWTGRSKPKPRRGA